MDAGSVSAAVVGAVFVYAGVSKALAGRAWPSAAARLGVPAPAAYATVIAEIVIGLGMVLGDSWQRGFLLAGAALLVAFTVLLSVHLRDDDRPPCACFGGTNTRPIGVRDIVRNVSLLALVFVAILS